MQETLFIQFAREPVPGRVKTRMLPTLTPEAACQLHQDMVAWTSRTLVSARLGRVELAVAGNPVAPLFQQCVAGGVDAVYPQQGEDLGQRMHQALQAGLQRAGKVVLVGSDCPQLDCDYLAQALAALDTRPVVLGPATDGGYVLIGVTVLDRRWFEQVKWGTEVVFSQTLAKLEETGTKWATLPPLQDIDRPEDLPLWQALSKQPGSR